MIPVTTPGTFFCLYDFPQRAVDARRGDLFHVVRDNIRYHDDFAATLGPWIGLTAYFLSRVNCTEYVRSRRMHALMR